MQPYRKLRAPWLFVGLLAWLTLAAGAAELSLSDAVKMAVERSPKLVKAREAEAVKALELENAKARRLPTLDLASSHGLQRRWPSPAGAEVVDEQGVALPSAPVDSPFVSQASLTLS